MSAVLIGCRFSPTEEELISYYLKNKILGLPMNGWESKVMMEAVIYGEKVTPWDLFRFEDEQLPWQVVVDSMGKFDPSVGILYVFSILSNVGKTEKSGNKQKNRVAGCGTWHGNNTPQPVFDDNGTGNRVIGYKRNFTFRSNQETVGQWTMCEYTINAEAHRINGNGFNCENYVLCRIKRDDAKSSKGGRLVCRKRNITSTLQDQGWVEASSSRQTWNHHECLSKKKNSNAAAADDQGFSNAAQLAITDVNGKNGMCWFRGNQEEINITTDQQCGLSCQDFQGESNNGTCWSGGDLEERNITTDQQCGIYCQDFQGATPLMIEEAENDAIGSTGGGDVPCLVDAGLENMACNQSTKTYPANVCYPEEDLLDPNLSFDMNSFLEDIANWY